MMKKTKCEQGSERGAALVIAIFSLMLISVVATALILTAGTQTAIRSNYKSAMHAFYDAKAGLEEARGRLWTNNPSSITNCVFPGGLPMLVGNVCYIVNPSPNENVDPTRLDPANPYADFEYKDEWGHDVIADNVQQPFITSVSPVANIVGPLYKWVRITPRTNFSAKFGPDNRNTALFFDGLNTNSAGNGAQVLTITSLAVTPYGSRRMLQYTVAASPLMAALPTFPSALTLDGNGVSFTGPSGDQDDGNKFQINGNDVNAPSGTSSGVPAIGYTNSSDGSNISSKAVPSTNYLSPAGTPNIGLVNLPPILETPSGLDSLVQSITRGADLVLNPPSGTTADQTSLTSMSSTNPMVVVVNGDFHLSHAGGTSFTGYGLLLVTGTLHYDPDVTWNGIILVIGKGVFDGSQHGSGGQINGTVFVANTRDTSGNLLTSLGPAFFNQTGGGRGIRYSSQLVTSTQALMPYQVLSFREIAQTIP